MNPEVKIFFWGFFLGFGFVQFENLGAKEKVLAREQHSIDGKLVRIFFGLKVRSNVKVWNWKKFLSGRKVVWAAGDRIILIQAMALTVVWVRERPCRSPREASARSEAGVAVMALTVEIWPMERGVNILSLRFSPGVRRIRKRLILVWIFSRNSRVRKILNKSQSQSRAQRLLMRKF